MYVFMCVCDSHLCTHALGAESAERDVAMWQRAERSKGNLGNILCNVTCNSLLNTSLCVRYKQIRYNVLISEL